MTVKIILFFSTECQKLVAMVAGNIIVVTIIVISVIVSIITVISGCHYYY